MFSIILLYLGCLFIELRNIYCYNDFRKQYGELGLDKKDINAENVSEETESPPSKPLICASLTLEYKGCTYQKTTATLYDEMLEFSAESFSLTIKLCDIISVSAVQYKINVLMHGQTIILSMLGHLFEDFAKRFIRACNEVFFVQSLMKERIYFEAKGQYISPGGEEEPALFRICETALVVIPDAHALVRIPFCFIASADMQPYRLMITDRIGRTYTIAKMGRLSDKFLLEYENRFSALIRQTVKQLSEIVPVSEELARLMMEGLVTRVEDLNKVSPSFTGALDKYIMSSSIALEYSYIKSVTNDMAVGIKRGLMGDLTGDNLVLLAPVEGKNRVIMESLGASAATYVFKMDMDFKRFLPLFNESMLAVNFRREPIYLSENALNNEKYENYLYAIMRCPALVKLRAQYLGRAVHSSFDTWEKAIGKYID